MAVKGPVTELVEMQLLGRWSDFFPIFESTFLPVLLAAPGILSVRTGPRYARSDCYAEDHAAISITQWSSLRAHEDFLNGPIAKGFFERLEQWMAGPPTVAHYEVGSLHGHEGSPWISMIRSGASAEGDDRNTKATLAGRCIEDDRVKLRLTLYGTKEEMRGEVRSASDNAFGMRVESLGSPSSPSKL